MQERLDNADDVIAEFPIKATLSSIVDGTKDKLAHLQHQYAVVGAKIAYNRLRRILAGDNAQLARLLSCTQMGAMEAFNTTPSESKLRITNSAYAVRLAYTLGSEKTMDYYGDRMSTCGSLGCRKAALSDDANMRKRQHIVNCKTGGGHIARHDEVKIVLQEMLVAVGNLQVHMEPRSIFPGCGQGGPDILVRGLETSARPAVIDYTVVNCFQPKHPSCASVPLTAAAKAERGKKDKYSPTSRYLGYHIIGAATESTGAFGKGLQHILYRAQTIHEQLHPNDDFRCPMPRWLARRFGHYWRKRIAVAAVNGFHNVAQFIRYGKNWDANRARRMHDQANSRRSADLTHQGQGRAMPADAVNPASPMTEDE